MAYPMPPGVHAIPTHLLDLRPDKGVDHDLLNPKPITDEKNIWFYWHSGYAHMHPYTQRNIRAWHRRFTKQGWALRVLDRVPGSPSNVTEYLDITDPQTFPQAFIDGTIGGDYGVQHTSDLVRFPLLLAHGGVYADVGLMQIGDLDGLWRRTVGDAELPIEVLSYNGGDGKSVGERQLMNYFLVSGRGNPFFARCHRLLLALWAAEGGKTSTDGMHKSALLKGIPLMSGGDFTIEENGVTIGPREFDAMLSDYIIQGHVITMVMNLVDEEGDWNGPEYIAKHVYAIGYMVGSQLINQLTSWDGQKAFNLISLALPKPGQPESPEQKQAREIVEACLQQSFGFKLAHGLILRVSGPTVGSLWREHTNSDNVPGTYAHWLRYGMVYWEPDVVPAAMEFELIEPAKRGPLLREV
ncbi:hypothetical protein LTR08_007854 [Meristemomyces frigidus]|nr:hypothetical protein LTR08_007854 [Meristemomyces frigidus]